MDGVAGLAAIVCDGGPVVLSIHIEGEGTRRPELLEGAVASGEGERLQVQLKAEGRREGDVEPRRQVELALVELPEHVARAVRRPGGGIGLRGDELRGCPARGVARAELQRHRGARPYPDHGVHVDGPGAGGVAEVVRADGAVHAPALVGGDGAAEVPLLRRESRGTTAGEPIVRALLLLVDEEVATPVVQQLPEDTHVAAQLDPIAPVVPGYGDRKSTRLNSSHSQISYAVFCLKKKKFYSIARSEILN